MSILVSVSTQLVTNQPCMGLFSVRYRGWGLRSYLRQISGICQHQVWTCVNDRGHWAFLGSLIPFFSASKGQFKAGYMGEALITSKIFCTSHPKKTLWNLGIRRPAEIQTIEALSLKSPRLQNDDLFRVSPQKMDHPRPLTITHVTHVTQPPVPPKSDDNHDKVFPLQKAWETQQQFYQNTWETLWLGMEVSRSCVLLFSQNTKHSKGYCDNFFKPFQLLRCSNAWCLSFFLSFLFSYCCYWCCGRGFWSAKNSFATPSG